MNIKPIGVIHTPFPEKFGIPRQSGLADTESKIVFLNEYRNPDAVRGLEGYSHIWLIWQFSQSLREGWSPTVRPPRLGGNKRVGVFATRSPFRPNELGLSSVELVRIDYQDKNAPVLYVKGADILDGTPIFDIKPYLSFTDSHPDAICGFADENFKYHLDVYIPPEICFKFPSEKLLAFKEILSNDPRPAYQSDENRVYKMTCFGYDTEFTVNGSTLTVININKSEE